VAHAHGVHPAPGPGEASFVSPSKPMRILALLLLLTVCATAQTVRRIDGYRGIWFTLGQFSEYGDKYSGGLGTYTAKHRPLAAYSPTADKTFFVYGGTTEQGERHLLAMIGAYDHATGLVEKPVVVHDKLTVDDPHDNPSLSIDAEGRLWVFVSGRGQRRPGFIYRSREPHSIDAGFEQTLEGEFTYPQPWYVPGKGFLLLMTRYTAGRELYWQSSPDGLDWTPAEKIVSGGHYQMSARRGDCVATAYNAHPNRSVDQRTNLYYLESCDMGRTWQTIDGETITPPLDLLDSPALIADYRSSGRLVYLKDMHFEADGSPVLLFITSRDYRAGPSGDPRRWTIARRDQGAWSFRQAMPASHNYDMGTFAIEHDGTWRLTAPTEPGPQRWGAGGEVALWSSSDRGETWQKIRNVTADSPRNHSYVRRPLNAHPDFDFFWADGDPGGLSISRMYFADRSGKAVFQLPYEMERAVEMPIRIE